MASSLLPRDRSGMTTVGGEAPPVNTSAPARGVVIACGKICCCDSAERRDCCASSTVKGGGGRAACNEAMAEEREWEAAEADDAEEEEVGACGASFPSFQVL
jgi:hypothetical protein